MKPTLLWRDAKGAVTLGYRAVHIPALSHDVQAFLPDVRVY